MRNKLHLIPVIACFLTSFMLAAQEKLILSYTTPESDHINLLSDIKIAPTKGTASSSQSGYGIDKTLDGDFSTIYHSSHSNTRFPVTLTYEFKNTSELDYLVYYPRQNGSNGYFKEVEVYYTVSGGQRTKLGNFDLKGSANPSRISFGSTLKNPVKIEIKVLSGVGDNGTGYASCAEMEFYKMSDSAKEMFDIFTDGSCSKLKPGITDSDIKKISNSYIKQLAQDIKSGVYKSEFRVQEYSAYQHPDIMSKSNKTSTYGLRDNPTGIYATEGEDVIIFVGDTHGQNPTIFIQNPDDKISGTSYPLGTGFNRFKAPFAGLMYVIYYTETGEESAIKVNINTGTINGYFDNQKHTKEDWSKILSAATFKHFDIKGNYATMTFETSAYRKIVSDGLALINLYDQLVYDEQEFMGLVKYKKRYKNRAHFQVVYGNAYMYSGGNHTGYNANTQSSILDVNKLTGTGYNYAEYVWGPAHELGHTHQTRPGLAWHGMAEVTNNLHSAYIQTKWTGKCRLQEEKMTVNGNPNSNRYQKAFVEIIDAKIPHNEHKDPFCKLVPFWQLKLYLIDILGKTEFYKDLYEMVRTTPDFSYATNHGAYQMQFVEFACKSANLDLTEFFEAWGFLTPVNITIDDYGVRNFTVTEAMIATTKANIAAKGYSKPPKDFSRITDNTVNYYK
ncbi:hypothetical protein D0T49_05400 [Paludibacter sp. 221]|uniref:M60 family metallopeptidase n=1 Tax=Paludibacter sp. 221 TaxID=2302939 RepID=UPI0013D5849B|nr:M60 family metallopeptidase [Paludibacter sp. 221]NDV46476.1 hypothetical protein [Paludibacter sp. 221]